MLNKYILKNTILKAKSYILYNSINSYCLFIICLVSLPLYINAQDNSKQSLRINNYKELQKDIELITESSDFSNANIGICIQSLESGEYLFTKNWTKNFIPASTQKILTTASAIEYLGKDFRYYTSLYLDGKILSNGEFQGNIIVRGSGDPTLSSYFYDNPLKILEDWGKIFDSLGIKSIRGNLIGDDRYFDKIYYPSGWSWDDMIFPYSAQISALTICDNKVDINIRANDTIGKIAKIKINPVNYYVRVINNVITIPKNRPTEILPNKDFNSNVIELNGAIALDTSSSQESTISVAVNNPTSYFLDLFRYVLEKKDIRFRGAILDAETSNEIINYSEMQPIAENYSVPLSRIISVINKYSNNLASEILLKTIAKETLGIGSTAKGIEQVTKFVSKIGINPDNISYVDGSGLSRLNLFSPKYQVELLSYIYKSEYKDLFINSLAFPGSEGTLKRRMTKSLAEKNVKAKTGSMNNVSTLCGYIKTRDNEYLAFSIMIQNFTVPMSLAQNLQDLICMRLSSFSR